MSKEQLTESQGQLEGGSPEAASASETHQLPRHVYQQVVQIRPGDAVGLQGLLAQYPDLSQSIASVASHHAGMSTVKQAMSMQARLPTSAPLAQGGIQADIRPGGEFALEGAQPELQKDYRAGGAAELETATPAKQADHQAAAPAWIASAHHYNNAHSTLVDEFNELTDNTLALDDIKADPKLIARWQRDHGIAGDGKVGPQTVATARARRGNPNAIAKADAPANGALIDV